MLYTSPFGLLKPKYFQPKDGLKVQNFQLDNKNVKLFSNFCEKHAEYHHNWFLYFCQDDTIHTRRTCVLKSLCIYLNEDHEKLVKEYKVS